MKKALLISLTVLSFGVVLSTNVSNVLASTTEKTTKISIKTGAVPSYGLIEYWGAPAVNPWNKFFNPHYKP